MRKSKIALELVKSLIENKYFVQQDNNESLATETIKLYNAIYNHLPCPESRLSKSNKSKS